MRIIICFLLLSAFPASCWGVVQDSSQAEKYEKFYNRLHNSDPRKAFGYLDEMEALGRNTNDTSVIYDAYHLKGKHFLGINIDSSLYYFRYLDRLIDQDETDKRINLNNNIGLAYQYDPHVSKINFLN